MSAQTARNVVIDARPRGPNGPLAGETLLGRPVLGHLLAAVERLGERPVAIHARVDEHDALRAAVPPGVAARVRFATGPPPEHSAILRADRLYDPARLRRALTRGRDPESAGIWRLARPRGLAGAADELVRRQTYQPLGRYWALGPARLLARILRPTPVRPNALTCAAGALVLAAAGAVAFGPATYPSRGLTALALALALVLDTSDGHLARLQGTASAFGRWLDANLDELGDMALHAGAAWAAYARDPSSPAWLLVGMAYAMGKYLFVMSAQTGEALGAATGEGPIDELAKVSGGRTRRMVVLAGHADIRWHLWIVLAAVGRMDAALAIYAAYFPLRTLAGAARKVVRHA